MLSDFQNCCTVGKRMKFGTKPIRHYPSHPRHVATLPCDIKNANFSADIQHISKKNANKLHFIASTFVIHPQISIFSVFKIASFPHTDFKLNFPCHCVLLVYFCDQFVALEIRHSRRHSSVCQHST